MGHLSIFVSCKTSVCQAVHLLLHLGQKEETPPPFHSTSPRRTLFLILYRHPTRYKASGPQWIVLLTRTNLLATGIIEALHCRTPI